MTSLPASDSSHLIQLLELPSDVNRSYMVLAFFLVAYSNGDNHFHLNYILAEDYVLTALAVAIDRRGKRGGQAKLSVEDQSLVVMEYWREYRTQFQIGVSWGVDETTVGRMIRKVEDILVKCGNVYCFCGAWSLD